MKQRAWAWKSERHGLVGQSFPLPRFFPLSVLFGPATILNILALSFAGPTAELYWDWVWVAGAGAGNWGLELRLGTEQWEWRMWAAGGNTQYKSQLDLCHAFNWLLCRCRTLERGVPAQSLSSFPFSVLQYQCEYQSWSGLVWSCSSESNNSAFSSISWKIEFFLSGLFFDFLELGLKNTSGNISARFSVSAIRRESGAAIKTKFFYPPPSSGFCDGN